MPSFGPGAKLILRSWSSCFVSLCRSSSEQFLLRCIEFGAHIETVRGGDTPEFECVSHERVRLGEARAVGWLMIEMGVHYGMAIG